MVATFAPTADTLAAGVAHEREADLARYDSEIASLNCALRDTGLARAAIEAETEALERLEAGHVLDITGGNAEERRARLTLALADDARHQQHVTALRTARAQLLDADRRVQVARERCRLLRLALTPVAE